ncbi:MAG: hypothetical protein MSH11_08685 [Ruminococcus sp.]|nr:hypothetical protein [Ruminococcus sp.]
MLYKVVDIIEPDFGCEGIPDGEILKDDVVLISQNGERITLKAEDEMLYKEGIDVGSSVKVCNNKIIKA